jgi:hypothetical protein
MQGIVLVWDRSTPLSELRFHFIFNKTKVNMHFIKFWTAEEEPTGKR